MTTRAILSAFLLGAVLVVGTACTASRPDESADAGEVFPDSSVLSTIEDIPHETLASLPEARLAEGLIPPTNRWFSGLVFGAEPQPVYPLPLAFSVTAEGFEFGVPPVQTGTDTISSGPSADVSAVFPTAVTPTVIAYDDASVTMEFADVEDRTLGTVTVAAGSPIVSFTAGADTTIGLKTPPEAASDDTLFTTTVAGREYGMTGDGAVEGSEVTLSKGESVTWFAVPDGGSAQDLAASAQPVTAVDATYSVSERDATTTLAYDTSGSEDTVIAVLPHQYAALTSPEAGACTLGTYDSVYGTMHLCEGREISWTAPATEPSDTLDLAGIDDAAKDVIRDQLAADVELPVELPDDTYFGGKALYRLANLLQVATQLDDAASADKARTRLVEALTDWTTVDRCTDEASRCFVYDPEAKGLVGKVASFGSEEFNDHHFHYGYFLYAAAIAVADDPSLQEKLRPVMDLIAADIATDADSSLFPDRRAFDPYAGHSWASGSVPFRDGNNQESSSEAVAAWNGLALWADATDNAPLSEHARWMLASEAATAQAYWVGFDESDRVYEGYGHSIVALNWGAKRDYSTWFSAEANAKLGIQLIPMTPASGYLAADPARITENLAQGAPAGFDVQFGDYLLMYAGLRGPDQAADAYAQARNTVDLPIDDANSRAYLLAFLASEAAK